MNTSNATTATVSSRHSRPHRHWALPAACGAATLYATLLVFAWGAPAVTALLVGDAPSETRNGLRMMAIGTGIIACTYPILLLWLARGPVIAARPALGLLSVLTSAMAVPGMIVSAVLSGDVASGLSPLWVLPGVTAALVWLARPPRVSGPRARRDPARLLLVGITTGVAAAAAFFHTLVATFQSWPAELLISDIAAGPKAALYAMWLFSCVAFVCVPVALVWSLRAPAAAARAVLGYLAVLQAAFAVSRAATGALGLYPEQLLAEPLIAGAMAVLTALCAPSATPSAETLGGSSALTTPVPHESSGSSDRRLGD